MFCSLEGNTPTCKKDTTNETSIKNDEEMNNSIEIEETAGRVSPTKEANRRIKDERKVEVKSTEQQKENECCSLALDIVSTSCLYVMSIFFMVGSAFTHPKTYPQNRPSEPFVFMTLGTISFLTTASIEVYKNRKEDVVAIVMSSLVLVCGVFWFIGSIFLHDDNIMKTQAWGTLWIVGCLFNLTSITYGIVMVFIKSGQKPLFKIVSLGLSWLANLLVLVGAAHILVEVKNLSICGISNAAGILISGAVVYLIHSIFHTLALFRETVTFTIKYQIEDMN